MRVRWIKDTAAWRKGVPGGEEEREVAHQRLVRICEGVVPVKGPRGKLGKGGIRPML